MGAGLAFLRDCDEEVGEGARVDRSRLPLRIDSQGWHCSVIGARTVLTCEMGTTLLRTGPKGRLTLGQSVIMNFGTLISANQSVTIGDGVSIGQYHCSICDTEEAQTPRRTQSRLPSVLADPGVWIAARVTVLPGSKIGKGSVVSAGSIVSGEIPPGVVAGGIPARVLRKLHPGEAAAEVGEAAAESLEPEVSARPAPLRRGYIASDFTIGELERHLNEDVTLPIVDFESAPFGQVIPTLMSPAPADRDVLVVWTRPEAVIPAFARVLAYEAR